MTQNNALNQYSDKMNIGSDATSATVALIPLVVHKNADGIVQNVTQNNSDNAAARVQLTLSSGTAANLATGNLITSNKSFTGLNNVAGYSILSCETAGNGSGLAVSATTQNIKFFEHSASAVLYVMNGTGERTIPLQPCFLAYNSATDSDVTGDNTTYTIVCDTEVYDQGADYNNGTGVFTAPVTGRYQFKGNVYLTGLAAAHTGGQLYFVGSNRSFFFNFNPAAMRDAGNATTFHAAFSLDMDAADTVSMRMVISNGTKVVDVGGGATPDTAFSGELLF